ncbi:S-adenosyl-L-methionine-dependent methyltransferase [Pseudoneurospora amorphoporcata]|uniref:S-adenosyl-L-methionine-dependent methyltransferase n=1 Tax=Pseudoneurospora amorphoporcata TaxID=241081 RepID=A0AAN6SI32_9PEZI|nr:S-adenosyl-L-methionine-dependent methyltransferase [Pseudoneurospora amorphoporcata]
MSLYHESAAILTAAGGPAATHGGSLKSRIFKDKSLKSPPAQVYALALETSKWSAILKEVVEAADLLKHERKITPVLSLLLVHDLLLSKSGIALPATHGLRVSIERHKARLNSEFVRARIRRKCASLDALRTQVEIEARGGCPVHPRWIRVNTLKSTVEEQLATTFKGWEVVETVADVIKAADAFDSPQQGGGKRGKKVIHMDGHIPNLMAACPGVADFTKTEAYKSGKIILQDKASCFPAYLLDPRPERDGDVMDTCAAPGNKTTHLAAIVAARVEDGKAVIFDGKTSKTSKKEKGKKNDKETTTTTIYAFEKDPHRAKTLQKMVKTAGSDTFTVVNAGKDFLKVNPLDTKYRNVGALLLDPSCSGSGIVGRDDAPTLHLPSAPSSSTASAASTKNHNGKPNNNKRKQPPTTEAKEEPPTKKVLIDDDGVAIPVSSQADLEARIASLASFQLVLLQHAMSFPSAKRITYSTCSIHAGENEHVVLRALASEVAKRRGWKILKREEQVDGMRRWDVRGEAEAMVVEGVTEGMDQKEREEVRDAVIRAYYRDDGRGVMGFFVAGFVRDGSVDDAVYTTGTGASHGAEGEEAAEEQDAEGPFVRDEQGRIVRDENGIPTLKSTGKKAVDLKELEGEDESSVEYQVEGQGEGEPYQRDEEGQIVRDEEGLPILKEGRRWKVVKGGKGQVNGESESDDGEWGGFDD